MDKKDIKITLDKSLLNNKDYDFFHWDCGYELAKCKYGTWRINSLGEIDCRYVDETNNINEWNYSDIVNYYIKNNNEYNQAIDDGRLILNMNNWFSIEFFDNDGNYDEDGYFIDSVYGSIREALEDFKWHINYHFEEMVDGIIKESE